MPLRVRPRRLLAAICAALASACGGSGGHTPSACRPTLQVPAGTPFSPTGTDCQAVPALPAGQPFALSGTVTYDFVRSIYDPASGTGGLDFAGATPRPVRGAAVEIRQCNTVLATATTDESGRWSATIVPGATGRIYAAALARTADPPILVQDNTDGAIWAVAQPLDSARATLDLHATHGWDGCAYGAWRIAAPFAILDSVYTAERALLAVRAVPFASAPLTLNWSPLNFPSSYYSPQTGAIVISHFSSASDEIFVLGAQGSDADEFDRSVIVHEWAHYFDFNFSRSDTPGGTHTFGDVLDPRLAFGEGGATAVAAMVLEDPIYSDTIWFGPGPGPVSFGWDAETVPSPTDDPTPGPFSELTVIRALWDLHDAGANEPFDTATIGLGAVHDALVGPQRTTPALTTLASFVAGLKAQPGVDAAAVDGVLAHYGIGSIATPFGRDDPALTAMFTEVPPPSATPASFKGKLDGRYAIQMQPQNRYYFFTATGTRAMVATASSYDVDLEAYHAGRLLAVEWSPSGTATIRECLSADCGTLGDPGFPTTPGETYVVVLTGWGGYPSYQSGVQSYGATVTFTSP